MDRIRVIHDQRGKTLTIWFGDSSLESFCSESADEVVIMKDDHGRAIGFEVLHYDPSNPPDSVFLETFPSRT